MPATISPYVSLSRTIVNLKEVEARSIQMASVEIDVPFQLEVRLLHRLEDDVTASLLLQESGTVFQIANNNLPGGVVPPGGAKPTPIIVWQTKVTDLGSSALVQPPRSNYSYPLEIGMSKSLTEIGIRLVIPDISGSFTRKVQILWINGSQEIEVTGIAIQGL